MILQPCISSGGGGRVITGTFEVQTDSFEYDIPFQDVDKIHSVVVTSDFDTTITPTDNVTFGVSCVLDDFYKGETIQNYVPYTGFAIRKNTSGAINYLNSGVAKINGTEGILRFSSGTTAYPFRVGITYTYKIAMKG